MSGASHSLPLYHPSAQSFHMVPAPYRNAPAMRSIDLVSARSMRSASQPPDAGADALPPPFRQVSSKIGRRVFPSTQWNYEPCTYFPLSQYDFEVCETLPARL